MGKPSNSSELPDGTLRQCEACGTTDTPKWRCGMTLCNACGLRSAKRPGRITSGFMHGAVPITSLMKHSAAVVNHANTNPLQAAAAALAAAAAAQSALSAASAAQPPQPVMMSTPSMPPAMCQQEGSAPMFAPQYPPSSYAFVQQPSPQGQLAGAPMPAEAVPQPMPLQSQMPSQPMAQQQMMPQQQMPPQPMAQQQMMPQQMMPQQQVTQHPVSQQMPQQAQMPQQMMQPFTQAPMAAGAAGHMHTPSVPQRVDGSTTPPMNGDFAFSPQLSQVLPPLMLSAHPSVDVAASAASAPVAMTSAPAPCAPPHPAENAQPPMEVGVHNSSFPAISVAMPAVASDPLAMTTSMSVAPSAEADA